MRNPTDGELRKRARDVEARRHFGGDAAPLSMVPPPDEALFKRFTLSSGNTYFPNFRHGGRVIVKTEADAAELLREGWTLEKRNQPPEGD
jgi:hypothetical protein